MNFQATPLPWAWIGVDPGLKGGIVLLREAGPPICVPMPVIRRGGKQVVDVVSLVGTLTAWALKYRLICAIEHPFIKGRQGGALTIGMNYGMLLAAFHFCGLDPEEVDPQTWQARVLVGIIGDEPKIRAAEFVAGAHPGLPLRFNKRAAHDHDGVIDAICIATYRKMGTGG